MNVPDRLLAHKLHLDEHQLWRCRQVLAKDGINFSSNDYLNLAGDTSVRNAYREGYLLYDSASRGSMVLGGYQHPHRELEEDFSQFLGTEDSLIFSSGYAANLAIISLLKVIDVHCLLDKANHASIYDGIKLNGQAYTRYSHVDYDHLRALLNQEQKECVILTEGIFSMGGQIADLATIASFRRHSNDYLIVDEAHSFGVLGLEGRGAVDHFRLGINEVPLRIIPLGKAMAAQGAIVSGQRLWIEALVNVARSYLYSTAISPALAHGIRHTLKIMREQEDKRSKLRELITYFRAKSFNSTYSWVDSSSPIQHLKIGHVDLAIALHEKLKDKGLYCGLIRTPTVSQSMTGLRVVLNASHQFTDIDRLFEEL